MKRILLTLLACLPLAVMAQKPGPLGGELTHPIDQREARLHIKHHYIGTANMEEAAAAYLKEISGNFSVGRQRATAAAQTESAAGHHFSFRQYVSGVRMYRSQSKVNVDKQGYVRSVIDNTYNLTGKTLPHNFPSQAVVAGWMASNGVEASFVQSSEIVYFPEGDAFIACMRLEIAEGNHVYYEVLLDEEGNEIYLRDLLEYFGAAPPPPPTDTTVTGNIFLPDPLSSAGVQYGGAYSDNSDADSQALTNELVEVTVPVQYENGLFLPSNEWVELTDHDAPAIAPHSSSSDDWRFTRAEDAFEDVMILYYLHMYKSYIDSLGQTSLMNYQIDVDPHALSGADNSNFNSSGGNPRLNFGQGGIDDAEDSDVIIHEYGHAISYSAAPGTNAGTQRKAMDEAIGDYFAASFSKSITDYQWGRVYSWDGNHQNWHGRTVVSVKHWPEDLTNNLYADAEIWSSTIMQVYNNIGRERADNMMMQALYSYEINLTMPQAAALYIQADTLLYNGLNYNSVCLWFELRGLYSNCVVGVDEAPLVDANTLALQNSEGFANGGFAQLLAPEAITGTMSLYSLDGKLVWTRALNGQSTVDVSGTGLNAGLWLLVVEQGNQRNTFKLSRL